MRRDSKWYFQAYNFFKDKKGYNIAWGSFLDGIYIHHCVVDKDGTWLGPEIIENKIRGTFQIAEKRLLTKGDVG